ncbi:FG-GAP repeat domain-containing protein [Nonomuraea gerenzanensis]|uniref:Integrin-like protein n=1 Tax=Nonomuraea gerenzanensis TaxID=93944 RepID=A0A1M4EAJ9_9ACTN|nr:VCBS repeat-containing protein [Nonomuraea gerenzanensis]UBU17979.1 VCBS repeat-containing protein [Nonomuraea gerenzanensis]SBO95782.1 integrin-like protein [Nonomuraea gerenzanensis]
MARKAMISVVAALALAGCGGEPSPGGWTASSGSASSGSASPGPASTSPPTPPTAPPTAPTAPTAPTGSAAPSKRKADDVNGDGYADLVAEFGPADGRRLGVVPGSPKGLVPAKGVVVPPATFTSWLIGGGFRADLDGDGFGDILGYGAPPDPDQAQGPHILWGGRDGVAATARPIPVRLPAKSGGPASYRAVAGDYDGDGAADLAMATPPGSGGLAADLTVLYGPFTRQGAPARSTVQPSPTGGDFWRMVADEIDGRRATALLVYEGDDGEQVSGVLLAGGPGGLARAGRKLNRGMAAAFGDFDGDGTRDVAVGDDGSRNNEPGYETEPPTVDRTLTVYYGDGRQAAFKGGAGGAVSGDFDGDGRDDLAFGGAAASRHVSATTPKVFRGGPGGLGAGTVIAGLSGAGPLAAGDYDGDGDDELVFTTGRDDSAIVVTDGAKVLTRFETADMPS